MKALANSLQRGNKTLSNADYAKLLGIYARSHRKDGKPYLAEALHPDTGSFEGHDGYNHSEHYLHSGYCDLVITGLAGLVPRDDDAAAVHPLAPADWDYFALDDVPYRGHLVSIVWDKNGERYKLGKGLHVLVDGKTSRRRGHASARHHRRSDPSSRLPTKPARPIVNALVATNFAVNNDGTFYPAIAGKLHGSAAHRWRKVNDGNYWYLLHPPNRWTCQGSPNKQDWLSVDFGTPRTIHTVKLYVLDDTMRNDSPIAPPESIKLESWTGGAWEGSHLPGVQRNNLSGPSPTHA